MIIISGDLCPVVFVWMYVFETDVLPERTYPYVVCLRFIPYRFTIHVCRPLSEMWNIVLLLASYDTYTPNSEINQLCPACSFVRMHHVRTSQQ